MRKSVEIGQKFNRCTIVGYVAGSRKKPAKYIYKCDCGNIGRASGNSFKNGNTKSCGCYKNEVFKVFVQKHGKYLSSEYRAWAAMIQRCSNRENRNFKNYGSRGIKVCKRWRSFENFYADMGDRPSAKHSVDRQNNNKGYSKQNCRWATLKQQNSNTRRNRYFTYKKRTLHLSDWAKLLGLDGKTLYYRLAQDWPKRQVFAPKK